MRENPDFPLLGVGVLVFSGERILLIKRSKAPYKGKWTIPGGLVTAGETLLQAATRELYEECQVQAHLNGEYDFFEYIQKDGDRVAFHYVIIDFVGDYSAGN